MPSATGVAIEGEDGVALLALTGLWVLSFLTVKRGTKKQRRPFSILKCAIPWTWLSLLCTMIWQGMALAGGSHSTYKTIVYMQPLSMFLFGIGDIALLICMVEMNTNLMHAMNLRLRRDKLLRYSTLVIATALAIISIAILGLDEDYSRKYAEGTTEGFSRATVDRLYGIWYVIYWLISLGLVGLTGNTLGKSIILKKHQALLRRFFAVGMLNLLRSCWKLFFAIKFYFMVEYVGIVVALIDPILFVWSTVVMYGLLIFLGIRRYGGTWTDLSMAPRPASGDAQQEGWMGYIHPPDYGRSPASGFVAPFTTKILNVPPPTQQQYFDRPPWHRDQQNEPLLEESYNVTPTLQSYRQRFDTKSTKDQNIGGAPFS